MAGGKTAPVRQPALVLEPRVTEIPVLWDIARFQTSYGLLHHEAEDLCADEAFGGQQSCVPGIRAVFR